MVTGNHPVAMASISSVVDTSPAGAPRRHQAPRNRATDQKVWGSNPYGRADRIHRMTCASRLTRVASPSGSGPVSAQNRAQYSPRRRCRGESARVASPSAASLRNQAASPTSPRCGAPEAPPRTLVSHGDHCTHQHPCQWCTWRHCAHCGKSRVHALIVDNHGRLLAARRM
jgi:hypothetical protein